MKKAVQFGAGNIGRGFIGALLSQSGYHVVFADVVDKIIDKINEDKTYTVHVMDVECEDQKIENISGVNSTKPEAVDEIASADLVTTAVGLVILPRIAPTIAAAIEKRMADGNKEPMNIIACENAIRGTSQLKKAVYENLSEEGKAFADEYVGFPDCAVDRIVPPVKSENFIDVVVEEYYEWDVERASFKGEIPEIKGMTLVDDLMAYIERKLFTLNTGHCITSYLGKLRGFPTIDAAIADEEIYDIVSKAMKESGDGLIKKHGFDPEKHAAYIKKIIGRFKNPYLQDDVSRVGREPLRKLSPTDRLISPLTTAAGYGLPVDHLLVGVGAALHYDNPEDKQSVELQAKIKENQSKTQTLVDKKSDIDQQISMTQASISNLNEQVQQYSLLIANKQAELEASQAEEKRLNEQYKTRIRSMEETGSISYWAILFGANSFSDLLDKIDVIQEIAKADQLMMDKMKAVSEKITSERTELEQQMAELDVTREELDQQEQELEDQRAEADTLLGDMMKAYEEMNADYEQNMANEAELSDEIAKSEAAYYAALSKEEAERIAALNRQNNNKGSNSNSSGATNTGGWLYPLPYQCQVTDSYGYRTHPLTGKYSWHNGVDFGAAAGTAILATKSGTVTTAAYSAAWGYYVVINHGDGYSSLYAHQPSCSVSVGDYVTQGQTIGYVGSTGWSTGPHLHFTIYYNGADVNPFNYIG